jgi:hypothetical protein
MSVFKKIIASTLVLMSSINVMTYAKPNIFDFAQGNSEVILKYGNYRKTK